MSQPKDTGTQRHKGISLSASLPLSVFALSLCIIFLAAALRFHQLGMESASYITQQTPTLYAGVHQAEDWAVTKSDDAQIIDIEGAEFGQALKASRIRFQAYGTDIIIRCQKLMNVTIDDEHSGGEYYCRPDETNWGEVTIYTSFLPETHVVDITYAISISNENVVPNIDVIIIMDHAIQNIVPWIALIIWMICGALTTVMIARRLERRK